MNKLIILCFAFLTVSTLSAQKQIVWFDVGLKAQTGASGFLNQAISDSEDLDYTVAFGTGTSYGGKIGINFGYSGLAIDVMYNSAKQDIELPDNSLATVDWKGLDVYALFRNAKNLGYFEIGPKASFINSVNATEGGGDVTSQYNTPNFSGVLGFGANIMGSDGAFSGILGLRFEYQFTDFVNETGQAANAPGYRSDLYSNGYKETFPVFAGVVFELNWGIGYFGKAQCGARSKFIMF